jgi:hypothetical protein
MERLAIGLFLVVGTAIIMGIVLIIPIWLERNFNKFDRK